MVTSTYLPLLAAFFLSIGPIIGGGAGNSSLRAFPQAVRAMDHRAIPSDADMHHRTKWSRDLFILVDDDAGAPSLYMFERSGKPAFSAMLQIPGVARIRLTDFAASPDGTVWVGGYASSQAGQQSFFLAHVARDGQDIQMIRTNPYKPCQLSVGQDGTVWTVGYEVTTHGGNGERVGLPDSSRDVLRHFDSSGKLIASAIPASTVGLIRAHSGYLAAIQDRLGWYSPGNGPGEYVEFSLDMKVLNSYTLPASTDSNSLASGFALTPGGNAFVVVDHPEGDGRPSVLYELNRSANKWLAVDVPSGDRNGYIPALEGNDGESLIFSGPPEKSKLQVFQVSQSDK